MKKIPPTTRTLSKQTAAVPDPVEPLIHSHGRDNRDQDRHDEKDDSISSEHAIILELPTKSMLSGIRASLGQDPWQHGGVD
jgi:arsenate reductase-like glutaredoxin family protein